MVDDLVLVDEPAPGVRRLTLNRPEKRNALSNDLRRELFDALRVGDGDRGVAVMVIRGAGTCFSAGYDLAVRSEPVERHTAAHVDGWWSRHVVAGWFELADMATPIIAQVHGYCLAGGSELAAACDLVYVADDAQVGYPPVRLMSPPDFVWQPWLLGMRRAMEALLTGDSMSGTEAAATGFANRAVPAAELEAEVLRVAARVAKVPGDLLALNKRVVHRSMEVAGLRAAARACADIQAMGFHQASSAAYLRRIGEVGVSAALSERDGPFGDYRERGADADGGPAG